MKAKAQRAEADPQFRADVLAGLKAPIPAIPARWLYDRRGSELFEAITRLPEYYPTRTETDLLNHISADLAEEIAAGQAIVEFGSGSSAKTPILLHALQPSAYVAIDISGDFLRSSAKALKDRFPALVIHPVEADFARPLAIPAEVAGLPRLGFFPGSTIGNFVPESAVDLLRTMKSTLGAGSRMVIGIDRIKDVEILLRAYDDSAGLTAQFNLNLLHRINSELDGDIPVEHFRHRAIWNDEFSRIEMHLEALRDLRFTAAGAVFAFKAGSTIHTENSHKYGHRDSRILLRAGGWTVVREWADARGYFSILLTEAEPPRFAP